MKTANAFAHLTHVLDLTIEVSDTKELLQQA